MRFEFKENLVGYRDYGDLIVLYALLAKKVMALDRVAADIWRAIVNHNARSIDGVASYLSKKYEVDHDTVRQDAKEFVGTLVGLGALGDADGDMRAHSPISTNDGASWANGEGQIVSLLKQRDQIFTVMFEMTYRCNEKCVHCYVDQTLKSESLNVENCRRILDQLRELGCLHLMFSGGDPFMHPDFLEIFDYARTLGFVCDVFTNGQYLCDHPNSLERLIDGLPRAVFISLYGADCATHDSVTKVSGSFVKSTSVARALVKHGVTVVFNVMLMKSNSNQVPEIIKLAKDIGADYRLGLSYVYTNSGDSRPMQYFVNDKATLRRVLSQTQSRAMSQDEIIVEKQREAEDSICGACETAICIDPYGNVYPCVSLKINLGNALSDSIRDVWFGEKRKSLLEKLKWKNIPNCHSCFLHKHCQHCASMSIDETGDPLACNACDKLIAESLWGEEMERKSDSEIASDFEAIYHDALKHNDANSVCSWLMGCYEVNETIALKLAADVRERNENWGKMIYDSLSRAIGVNLQ